MGGRLQRRDVDGAIRRSRADGRRLDGERDGSKSRGPCQPVAAKRQQWRRSPLPAFSGSRPRRSLARGGAESQRMARVTRRRRRGCREATRWGGQPPRYRLPSGTRVPVAPLPALPGGAGGVGSSWEKGCRFPANPKRFATRRHCGRHQPSTEQGYRPVDGSTGRISQAMPGTGPPRRSMAHQRSPLLAQAMPRSRVSYGLSTGNWRDCTSTVACLWTAGIVGRCHGESVACGEPCFALPSWHLRRWYRPAAAPREWAMS